MSPPQSEPHERSVSYQLGLINERLSTFGAKLDGIHHAVHGNGEPERGLIVRLDRIEEREKTRAKLTWAAVGLAFSSFGALLGKIIIGKV